MIEVLVSLGLLAVLLLPSAAFMAVAAWFASAVERPDRFVSDEDLRQAIAEAEAASQIDPL